MVNQISNELDSYIEAMYHAASILVEGQPDFIVAPMMGSVPFVDVMHIVNNDFDISKVVYMPASSRIDNVGGVICDWYSNFLVDAMVKTEGNPRVVAIDEVVSGSSVVRCIKNVDLACNKTRKRNLSDLISKLTSKDPSLAIETIQEIDQMTDHSHSFDLAVIRRNIEYEKYEQNPELARVHLSYLNQIIKDALSKRFNYITLGIEDSKAVGKRSKEYSNLVDNGRVIPIGVRKILSMDIPDFCPPRFEEVEGVGGEDNSRYVKYTPFVKDFVITPRYLNFLGAIAKRVGKDPSSVDPINMFKILDSKKYLSQEKCL